MARNRLAYEDMEEGRVFDLGSRTLTAEEIIEFAGAFDAQPMHLDEEAGRRSLLGGLAASGWHTSCVFMRMMCDAFLLDSASQGSPGISEMRWRKPVLAGDTLAGSSTVLSRRRLRSRPGLGLVTFRHVVTNQRGETVIECENPILFDLRDPGDAA
ncbi:MaoC family dehydratase [Chelativorans sp. AA-79]|uniref:MaoC family dehydratase n=1 Tax=Chelativorans sp. AA-79 TaxID=3028735 RepID=UPI0023F84EC7|nr:MaoC family dehydratase [Chelativorans sp. AA-79]WEX07903.1 MaoC family dehydratase [Chelativorans sp. AA-79]